MRNCFAQRLRQKSEKKKLRKNEGWKKLSSDELKAKKIGEVRSKIRRSR